MSSWSEWQQFLYPIGFFSTLPFFFRFLIQWLESEKAHKSVLYPSFWRLSLSGNLILGLHAILQEQFPLLIAQGISGFIAIRNIQLMSTGYKKISFFNFTLFLSSLTALFFLLPWIMNEKIAEVVRVPLHFWQQNEKASFQVHMIGIVGQSLFSIRFIVQWLQAEKAGVSYLSKEFWWITLLGGFFTIIYSILIIDPVNILGPLFNLVPTIRNLIFLRRQPRQKKEPA